MDKLIELITNSLGKSYPEIKEGDILFSYKVFEGRAQSRNAIKLLELMGYDENIIESAAKCADNFLTTGQWQMG